jgi:TRAP-type C4-dicarboxylate transport system permease small subunit
LHDLVGPLQLFQRLFQVLGRLFLRPFGRLLPLKKGEHIRVELVLQKAGPRLRRALQLWSYGLATLLAALFAFYSVRLAWQSHAFNDISTANDATPLWLPQLAMALGTVVLFIAFVDELVLEWRGLRRPAKGGDAATHHE